MSAPEYPDATSELGCKNQEDGSRVDENLLRTLLEAQNKNMMGLVKCIQPVSTPKVILPDFDPDKRDVDARAWCTTADLCLTERDQEGSALIIALSGALKGNASRWLSQISFAGMTWSQFKDLFLARYGSIETPAATLINLQNSKLKENENMASYAARLSTRLMARFKDMTVEEVTLAIVLAHVSQFDGRLQRTAFTREIKTREQMQRELQVCTYMKRRSEAYSSDGPAHNKRPRLAAPPGLVRCFTCGKLGHRSADCLSNEFNRCGGAGHYSNKCPRIFNSTVTTGSNVPGNGGTNGSAAASGSNQRRVDLCYITNPTGQMTVSGKSPEDV